MKMASSTRVEFRGNSSGPFYQASFLEFSTPYGDAFVLVHSAALKMIIFHIRWDMEAALC